MGKVESVDLRRAAGPVRAGTLALNAGNEVETSLLDAARLDAMLAAAAFAQARVAADGAVLAFLIAFDRDAAYDSLNFLWFRRRLHRFLYVDRVIVSPAARGQGLARSLYSGLFARGRELGAPDVVAEVNAHPPNPGSDAFHAALGFVEVGFAELPGGKRVRYLRRPLVGADPSNSATKRGISSVAGP